MARKPTNLPAQPVQAATPLPADDTLASVLPVLRPLVRLLLQGGIDYTRFAGELKQLFVEQALAEIQHAGQTPTDSAISLMSGVHRKDVRRWREDGRVPSPSREVALSAQVFAQWSANPAYATRQGRPARLARTGDEPSFESLVRTVTQDVHPFTVLQEFIRLGIASVQVRAGEEIVVPAQSGFVPRAGSHEMLDLLAANLGDHALAAVSNVLGGAPVLEQSVYAAGITERSAERLNEVARALWARSRAELVEEATRLYEADKDRDDARTRIRYGSYFWAGPWEPPTTGNKRKRQK